jgi:hypothetical protein
VTDAGCFLQARPDDIEALRLLAETKYAAQDYSGAAYMYRRAIKVGKSKVLWKTSYELHARVVCFECLISGPVAETHQPFPAIRAALVVLSGVWLCGQRRLL